MRKIFLLPLIAIFGCLSLNAQPDAKSIDKLKVYIDCSNSYCDMTFIRTEINLVDFMLDRMAADVHVLVTQQETGGGGRNYQLIFFGQKTFKNMQDTLRFNTGPNATDFERRDYLVKYIQLGLAPYVAKTNSASFAIINFKRAESDQKKDSAAKSNKTTDPWNYWVFNIGLNGNYSADENYKDYSGRLNFSSSRVTDKLKVAFNANYGKNQSEYKSEDAQGNPSKIIIKNDNYSINHYLIVSMGKHWSYGYETNVSRSTYANNKRRLWFNTGIEFAIFPYSEVNTRFWTIAYTVDIRHNKYFDTTLFEKTHEVLLGHGLETNLSFNQKWGTLRFGAEYHNYLHNWKYFSLGLNTEVDIRITGGLSFNIYSFIGFTRDQLFIPKGGADLQEILTRRRQLASGYNFYSFFGLNYRFGSKLNNFVNPRFD